MNDAINSNTLNNPAAGSVSRRPRSIITVNGLQAQGVIEWEVDNNIHYFADAFRIELSLSRQPAYMDWSWWGLQTVFTVEVFVGFPKDPTNYSQDELLSLIIGDVDEIDIDPIGDRIILNGRDFTARFVETQTTRKWPNQFSATGDFARPGIVEILAKSHNMLVDSYHTSDRVGSFYKEEIVRITDTRSEWDLLTFLASEEGAEVFVRGNTLVFRQPVQTPGKPYVIQWTPPDQVSASPLSNAARIHLTRDLTLARDVIVFVRSWSQGQKAPITVKRQASHKRTSSISPRASPIGAVQTYFKTVQNKTRQQCLNIAQAWLADLTSLERRLRAEMPGDNLLSVDNPLQLTGTGTDFDAFYHVVSVVRSFSFEDGYTMKLEAKNHPAESEVVL